MNKLAYAALASIFKIAGSQAHGRELQPVGNAFSAIAAHSDATMQMSDKKMMKKKEGDNDEASINEKTSDDERNVIRVGKWAALSVA